MKKLMTIFGAILFASFILSSCGGGNKEENTTTNSNLNATTEKIQFETVWRIKELNYK